MFADYPLLGSAVGIVSDSDELFVLGTSGVWGPSPRTRLDCIACESVFRKRSEVSDPLALTRYALVHIC